MKRTGVPSVDPARSLAATETRRLFQDVFGREGRLYRAPGRVNLIGEHTDYNQGFVMPAAIDLYCWVAAAPRSDRKIRIHSSNLSCTVTADLDDASLSRRGDWSDYVVGTAIELQNSGCAVTGADLLVNGEVPIGSGLSSSAAIEISTGYALLDLKGTKIDRVELAIAGHRAENNFVGARVGVMDQFISTHGLADHALLLDCRRLQTTPLPIPPEVRLVVCNTGIKHELAASEYNLRRLQCEEGVRLLSNALPEIKALRDVSIAELERHKALLPDKIYLRCRHVITEDERVGKAAEALLQSNLPVLGKLMAESHHSLREDYEVSCAELDIMVEIAGEQPGLIGARMTGGGFGGCTVNLVHEESAQSFKRSVAAAYEHRTGIHPEISVLQATEGVQAVASGELVV